eukprot:15437086-Alexandrium_andersonii.AAC.1
MNARARHALPDRAKPRRKHELRAPTYTRSIGARLNAWPPGNVHTDTYAVVAHASAAGAAGC